jgi:hypothetical protein
VKDVLRRVKEERNILNTIKTMKDNRIGNILRRNCLLKQLIKGKIKVMKRCEGRNKQLLDDLHEARGYWKH